MSVRSRVSIVIKKAIMIAFIPNFQKTSVGHGSLRTGDW